jgi:colanic acid/amylovoran biosynthesis glycosyltransferase
VMSVPKPRVIVFCDHLLYRSETFIYAQASALSGFDPVFAGSRRVAGLDLRQAQIHTINHGNFSGKCRELCFKLAGFAPDFVRRLSAMNPVLMHAHYGPNGVRALPIAAQLNVPLIITFHGFDATATNVRRTKTYLGFRHYLVTKKKLKRSSALFLTVSKFIRGKLLEQGFPEDRVVVHYTGVDTKRFKPANTEAGPVVLFVGRLEPIKGPDFMIRAAAAVQEEMPEAELVMIGDGSLRADMEKLAKQSLRRYRFLGARTAQEVSEWMNRASVVCVPSIKRYSGEEEGFGMACAEAHAVSKPVVAFDSGGISEIVTHGSTGFLAPVGDWQALAKHLLMLLQNASLRERFGLAGRETVLRQFDLEHRTRILEDIYTEVLDQWRRRSDKSAGMAVASPIEATQG